MGRDVAIRAAGGWNDYRRHKARKRHRCMFCGDLIEPGTVFLRFVGEWQRDFQCWEIHECCAEVWAEVGDPDDALPDGEWSDDDYLKAFDRAGVAVPPEFRFGGAVEARWRLGVLEDTNAFVIRHNLGGPPPAVTWVGGEAG